jgi:hypothetical protein
MLQALPRIWQVVIRVTPASWSRNAWVLKNKSCFGVHASSGCIWTLTELVVAGSPAPVMRTSLRENRKTHALSAAFWFATSTVTGAGAQVFGTADGFNFAYQTLSGDGTIVARVLSFQGSSTSRSAGVMIRETLDADSTNAYVLYSGNTGIGRSMDTWSRSFRNRGGRLTTSWRSMSICRGYRKQIST